MTSNRPVMDAAWLGRVEYTEAHSLQTRALEMRKAEQIFDTLMLLEHDHVFTLGRRGSREHIYVDSSDLSEMGVDLVETDRGGEATYHGPGQLVAYPILSIRKLGIGPVAYVRMLEQAVIDMLSQYRVDGHRVVGKTGVWVGGEPGARPADGHLPTGRKIAAIGVRVSGGVAMHGVALNVSTDLSFYSHIVPCGMPGLEVTSVEKETGQSLSTGSVARDWAEVFAQLLIYRISWIEASRVFAMQTATEALSV